MLPFRGTVIIAVAAASATYPKALQDCFGPPSGTKDDSLEAFPTLQPIFFRSPLLPTTPLNIVGCKAIRPDTDARYSLPDYNSQDFIPGSLLSVDVTSYLTPPRPILVGLAFRTRGTLLLFPPVLL